LWGPPCIIH